VGTVEGDSSQEELVRDVEVVGVENQVVFVEKEAEVAGALI